MPMFDISTRLEISKREVLRSSRESQQQQQQPSVIQDTSSSQSRALASSDRLHTGTAYDRREQLNLDLALLQSQREVPQAAATGHPHESVPAATCYPTLHGTLTASQTASLLSASLPPAQTAHNNASVQTPLTTSTASPVNLALDTTVDTIEEADTTVHSIQQASASFSEIQSFSDERSRKMQSRVVQEGAAGIENNVEVSDDDVLNDSQDEGDGRREYCRRDKSESRLLFTIYTLADDMEITDSDSAFKVENFLDSSSVYTATTTIPTPLRLIQPDATKSRIGASARKSSITSSKQRPAMFESVEIVSSRNATAVTKNKSSFRSPEFVNSEDDEDDHDTIVMTSNAPKVTAIPEQRHAPEITSSQSSEDTIANFDARNPSTHTTSPGASIVHAASTSHSHLERAHSSAYPSVPQSSHSSHAPPKRSISAPVKRKKIEAVSEDEHGHNELAKVVEKVERIEEDKDEDFNYGKEVVKGKGKAKAVSAKTATKKAAGPRKNSKAAKAIQLQKQTEAEASKQEELGVTGGNGPKVTQDEGHPAPRSRSPSPTNTSKSRKKLRMVVPDDDGEDALVPDFVPKAAITTSTLPIPSSVLPASSPPPLPLPSTSTTTSKAPIRKSKANRVPSSSQSDSAHNFSANDCSDEEDVPQKKSKVKISGKKAAIVRKSSNPVESRISAVMLAAQDADSEMGLGADAEKVVAKEVVESEEGPGVGAGLNAVASTSKVSDVAFR